MVLLLWAGTVLAAPQKNSTITYVKRQVEPPLPLPTTELKHSSRESRIENLSLTIPGSQADVKEPTKNPVKETKTITEKPRNSTPTYNYSDRIYSIKSKPKKNNNTTPKLETSSEIPSTEAVTKSSELSPSESVNTDVFTKTETPTLNDETTTTEIDDLITENYVEEPTIVAIVDEETTRTPDPSPLSKLSHFGKSRLGSFSQNLIGISGKRRFRSRCRCERIWNCTKLQISVPRCPEEYFLCCS